MPARQAERQPEPGEPKWKGGRLPGARQTSSGRQTPHSPPASPLHPLFLGPLLSIVGCIFVPTSSPENQIGFLQTRPSRLPQSWCVGACMLPNRREISELSNKWISRLVMSQRAEGVGKCHSHSSPAPLPQADRNSTLTQHKRPRTCAHAHAYMHRCQPPQSTGCFLRCSEHLTSAEWPAQELALGLGSPGSVSDSSS